VSLEDELKQMLVRELNLVGVNPADLKDNDPLFVDGVGLDSLDAVELIYLLRKHFQVEIRDLDMGRSILSSIKNLADYIRANRQEA
jgi:acyl carrier protein